MQRKDDPNYDGGYLHDTGYNEAQVLADVDAQAREALRERVAGRQISVTRALVYEGEGLAVLDQLGRSLPVGIRRVGRDGLTIRVVEGPVTDCGAFEPVQQVRALLPEDEETMLAYLLGDTSDPKALDQLVRTLRERAAGRSC